MDSALPPGTGIPPDPQEDDPRVASDDEMASQLDDALSRLRTAPDRVADSATGHAPSPVARTSPEGKPAPSGRELRPSAANDRASSHASPARPYLDSTSADRLLVGHEVLDAEHEPASAPLPAHSLPSPHLAAGRDGRRRRRHALGWVGDLVLGILLALTCFGILLVVMSRILPNSTGIRDLLLAAEQGIADQGASAGFEGALQAIRHPGVGARWVSAALTVLNNEVMRKESSDIAWNPVRNGTRVTEGDGVQTTRQGMAVVAFDRDNRVRIGRNSLVILRRQEASELEEPTRAASMQLVSGELWGEFSGRAGAPVRIEVASGPASTVIETGGRGKRPAQFKVSIRDDGTSAIALYRGEARVSAAGRIVTLKASQYVTVTADGAIGAVRRQLDAPAPIAPSDREPFSYREFPPRIAFRWNPVAGAESYRLAISRDSVFSDVVLEDRTTEPAFSLGSLVASNYWWHVSATSDGIDGAPSVSRSLPMRQDSAPPALAVEPPPARVADDRCLIRGRTDPGSRVFVAGVRVPVGVDGDFRFTANLQPGMNLVVVEAMDEAGNASYCSKEIERMIVTGGIPIP